MKKLRTKKEIKQKLWELDRIPHITCITEGMLLAVEKATLEWALGERETLDLHIELVKDRPE